MPGGALWLTARVRVTTANETLDVTLACDVRDAAARAQSLFPGDRVEALTALAISEEHSLEDRNRAVWALSHVGDARAASALEQLKTDAPCDHARHVCQYELLKALSASRGEKFRPFSILIEAE